MSLPFSSLRQIASISLEFSPLSPSKASRSIRLLLARIPSRGPPGIELPKIQTKLVNQDDLQKILITYKDKKTLLLDAKASSVLIADLIRKIEGPAKALQLKEDGL